MAILSCKNLCIGYEGTAVVSGLNFEIRSGDYLAIIGENGAGKSTLIKTILGLIRPLSGEILTGDGLKKNDIGYLPQQTVVQRDFPASVWEVVISGCLSGMGLRPFFNSEEKARARGNIERMGLSGLENRSYRELSGGQQQRVLLARALCAAEKALLLDEPVSGLDPKAAAEMYSLIKRLNKDGITVIMISHDINAAVKYANRILHLGSRVFFCSAEEFTDSPEGKLMLSTDDGGEADV